MPANVPVPNCRHIRLPLSPCAVSPTSHYAAWGGFSTYSSYRFPYPPCSVLPVSLPCYFTLGLIAPALSLVFLAKIAYT